MAPELDHFFARRAKTLGMTMTLGAWMGAARWTRKSAGTLARTTIHAGWQRSFFLVVIQVSLFLFLILLPFLLHISILIMLLPHFFLLFFLIQHLVTDRFANVIAANETSAADDAATPGSDLGAGDVVTVVLSYADDGRGYGTRRAGFLHDFYPFFGSLKDISKKHVIVSR